MIFSKETSSSLDEQQMESEPTKSDFSSQKPLNNRNQQRVNLREDEVKAEQTRLAYASLNNALFATLVNTLILVIVLWPVIQHNILLTWLSVIYLVSFIRGYTCYKYKRTADSVEKNSFWYRLFFIGNLTASLIWASVSIWLFPPDNLARQVFIAFVIGGMGAGATTSLSSVKIFVHTYLCITLIPLLLRFFLSDSELKFEMGGMLTIFLAMLLIASKRTYENIRKSICLKYSMLDRELTIKQGEARFRMIFENMQDGYVQTNIDGEIIMANPAIVKLLGYEKESDLLGLNIGESIYADPKQRQVMLKLLQQQKRLYRYEMSIKRKDGSVIIGESNLHLRISKDGKVDGVDGVFRDVSLYKRIEAMLRESEQFQRTLFESSPDFIAVINWEGRFIKVNSIHPGYSKKEQVVGQKVTSFILAEYRSNFMEKLEQARKTGRLQKLETTVNLPDGTHYFYNRLKQISIQDKEEFTLLISTDITERRRIELDLKKSEKKFHAIFNQAFQLTVLLTSDGVLEEVNDTALSLIGVNESDVLGKEFHNTRWWSHSKRQQLELKKAVQRSAAGAIARFEITIIDKDGGLHYFDFSIKPVKDEADNVLFLIAEGRDISERKNAELGIVKAHNEAVRASQAKSEFLSRMSHELRTPLNAILGFSQMLELDADEFNPVQKTNVTEIIDAGHHLLNLINEVLDLARIESGNLEINLQAVMLDELIQQCLTLIQPQSDARKIKIIDRITGSNFIVNGDLFRLKQVLINILSNAVKYNSPQGTIELSCEIMPQQRLRICVSDTGSGLSEAQISKLFTPFERLNDTHIVEGAGIGLVIAKLLIEAMEGNIGVDCAEGQGCAFWVELPFLIEKDGNKRN